ncbi:protein roadkill-like isoform X1 [Schistocerca americana]|uniref:protein roadkill-like n=1 Tax=Schistocerca piceifrons TaxID=274613 RepID=UPI001F4F93FA|nr:protein roadkill-like isoform X1 [Schistocerca americana]XP_047121201.1 protein roadkill-like [Schistocerca piceifrons]XP_049764928.1 protein roadkill-like isoform X1 [Schistocerca cancellata]XP_049791383.1 protein roadkill-like isoform X1 [Schistocerca nitens]XP_049791384.1 protein roadkill-like isoform X1 [Schistocerca nitens]XP_049937447.1 protein roadkill-like isoform X1 [Schistocerca serialis cubense]
MSPAKTISMSECKDLGSLLDADFGMVTLVSGNTRLVVHKAVLEARSPVFAAMLQDMLEDGSDQLSIPDVEGPVLQRLVGYMYTLRLSQLQGLGPQLLAVADRYGVVGLRALCEQLLDVENEDD